MVQVLERADVAVVGGGIIGIACALELLAAGRTVVVVERGDPGAGTSGGSAGYLSDGEIFPVASPAVLRALPRMLFDRAGPLVLRPSYLPHMFGWGLRFFGAASPARIARGTAALASLNRVAIDALFALAERAGAGDLLVRDGGLHVAREPAVLAHAVRAISLLARHGIVAEAIDRAETLRRQPALDGDVAGAVVFPNAGRCVDPDAFGAALAAHARAAGATFVRAHARSLEPHEGGWTVRTIDGAARGCVRAVRVVVAAGAWSAPLLRPLGYRVPLAPARGYHLMLPDPGVTLRRTVLFEDVHFCATPMRAGLRLAGTVEFARIDAPPDMRRADMLFDLAARYLPGLRRDGATRWMGVRPAFPDTLPAISAVPKHSGLFACFGHEKLGLTQAAISARCIAALVQERPADVDLAPFALGRFG